MAWGLRLHALSRRLRVQLLCPMDLRTAQHPRVRRSTLGECLGAHHSLSTFTFYIRCSASPYHHRNYSLPTPQDPFAAYRQQYNTTPYPQQSAPSPYIPRQPMHPEMQSHDHPRRTHSLPTPQPRSRKKSSSVHMHIPWPSQGDLSPLDLPTRMPDVQSFTPRALDMHTPTSSFSRSISSGSSTGMFHDRPQEWRHDFKFKSGFASMFRSKPNTPRGLDGQSAYLFEISVFVHHIVQVSSTALSWTSIHFSATASPVQ